MTGATPNTKWLDGCVALDTKGFVETGSDLTREALDAAKWPLARIPFSFETSQPRVFAIGDVRAQRARRVRGRRRICLHPARAQGLGRVNPTQKIDLTMNIVHCSTERPGSFRQRVEIRAHELHADVLAEEGGDDSAPGAHDYFDASLAACKALTAVWYAKKNGIPLERVESHVERDDREERKGRYRLLVRLAFHGPLSEEHRARLHAAVARCPVSKLMTTSEIVIETEPLDAHAQ